MDAFEKTEGTLDTLLGVVCEDAGPDGHCVLSMPLDNRHWNRLGTAHGGSIFTLADNAFGRGCIAAGLLCVTAQASISYLRAGTRGPLKAEAKPVKIGRSLVVYDVQIYDGEGLLIAKAAVTGHIQKHLTQDDHAGE